MVSIDLGRFERRLKQLYEGWRVSSAINQKHAPLLLRSLASIQC